VTVGVLLALLLSVPVTAAERKASTAECRASCGPITDLCLELNVARLVAQGATPKRVRRKTPRLRRECRQGFLGRCRRQGVDVCVLATTSTTTTTLPPPPSVPYVPDCTADPGPVSFSAFGGRACVVSGTDRPLTASDTLDGDLIATKPSSVRIRLPDTGDTVQIVAGLLPATGLLGRMTSVDQHPFHCLEDGVLVEARTVSQAVAVSHVCAAPGGVFGSFAVDGITIRGTTCSVQGYFRMTRTL
jgi:hypothetical protein